MEKIKVMVDCDDVLFQCNGPALDRVNAEHPDEAPLRITDILSWGKTGTRLDERLKYFGDPEFVASQPLFDGAKEFIRELSELADVYILTAVPAEVLSARAIRIKQDFPEIKEDHIILASCKHLVKADVLLDDAPHNINQSVAKYPVLFRRPWNKDITGVMSVNNYGDFLAFVKQLISGYGHAAPSLKNGGVLCLIGASGAGKQHITRELCAQMGYERVTTYTTKPESAEHYTIVSEADFYELDNAGMLIEKSAYGGYHYGVPQGSVSAIVEKGNVAVLPIDICGAVTLRNLYPDNCILVYVYREKKDMLLSLLEDAMSDEEKVNRILGMDRERQNEVLCDFSVKSDENVVDTILGKIL